MQKKKLFLLRKIYLLNLRQPGDGEGQGDTGSGGNNGGTDEPGAHLFPWKKKRNTDEPGAKKRNTDEPGARLVA